MRGVDPWAHVNEPITPEAFEKAAKRARVPRRDRKRVWEWVKYVEARNGVWPSASHAIHAWIMGQLARR